MTKIENGVIADNGFFQKLLGYKMSNSEAILGKWLEFGDCSNCALEHGISGSCHQIM